MKLHRKGSTSRLKHGGTGGGRVFTSHCYIDISTRHITEGDDRILNEIVTDNRHGGHLTVYGFPYGYLVHLSLDGIMIGGTSGRQASPEDMGEAMLKEGYSQEFARLIVLYLQSGHYGIKFDRDGTRYAELLEFEW